MASLFLQQLTNTHLAVMDIVSSGPAMFARLFTVLPLEEVVDHGIILGTSSTRHTLRDTHAHYPEITGNSNKQSVSEQRLETCRYRRL